MPGIHLSRQTAVLAALSVALTAATAAGQSLPRKQTLYISGWQYGTPTSFNPIAPTTAAWPVGNSNSNTNVYELVYETLFTFNSATGELEPLLASKLEAPSANTLRVTLHDGTRWQDGKPLTSADVVYSYELAKRHDVSYSALWDYVTSVKADGPRAVTIQLNPKKLNPGLVRNYLGQIVILPQHIWAQLEKSEPQLLQYTNMKPVGSGPYQLQSFNPERVIAVRNDQYWGKKVFGTPAPKYVVHPIFKGNDNANLALQQGHLDMSQNFIPEVWEMSRKAPVKTWLKDEPYHLPGNIPLLFVNTQRKGLDNPLVRRAIAYSINYPLIAQTAMSRYSVPVRSSLIIPEGSEKKFFDTQNVKQHGWTFDPQRAVNILEKQLGAKKGSDGVYVLPDGTRLGPWKLMAPNGWTDWNQALQIVSSSAKAVGIDLRTDFPQQSVWQAGTTNGDFDLALRTVTGASPAGPWTRFRDVLDSRGVAGIGQPAFWNFGRYSNPSVGALLDRVAAAPEKDQKQLYAQLDEIFMKDVPAIPLMYRPYEFYQVNESTWTGFATGDNPYAAPQNAQAGVKMLYRIKSR